MPQRKRNWILGMIEHGLYEHYYQHENNPRFLQLKKQLNKFQPFKR